MWGCKGVAEAFTAHRTRAIIFASCTESGLLVMIPRDVYYLKKSDAEPKSRDPKVPEKVARLVTARM